MTINGRILLANSLCYSKFYHLTNVFPISGLDSRIKLIEELVKKFIWNNKKPLSAKRVLYCKYEDGAQKSLNILAILYSQKMMWVKRSLSSEDNLWKYIFDYYVKHLGGSNALLHCSYGRKEIVNIKLPNFYFEIIELWCKIPNEISKKFLWNNKNI